MEKYKFPGCYKTALKTWALVRLCPHHFYEIYNETQRYYNGRGEMKITHDERDITSRLGI